MASAYDHIKQLNSILRTRQPLTHDQQADLARLGFLLKLQLAEVEPGQESISGSTVSSMQKQNASRSGPAGEILNLSKASVILLVEDDPDDALLTSRAIERAGLPCEIRRVHDGEEAINYLSGQLPYQDRTSHPLPSLVLLDLKMPKISGFEVLSWLRNAPSIMTIPVIVLTGSVHPEDRVQAKSLGAAGFETKPLDFSDFATLVKNLVPLWLPQSSKI